MKRQIVATCRLLFGRGPESRVPKRWLLASSSRLDEQFWQRHQAALMSARSDDDFSYVEIEGQTFVWPRRAPLRTLAQILSELLQPGHPHFYDQPPTRIQPGDVVLDVGACEGAFAAYAVGRGAVVCAVEPSLRMAAVIRRLFELRRLEQPRVVQNLLGGQPGELFFTDDEGNPGASRVTAQEQTGSYRVRCVTLDEFVDRHLPDKLDFIKCDAEGWDCEIFFSGERCLRKFRPKIAVTTYHNSEDYERIETFLQRLGYRCFPKGLLLVNDRFRPLMLHATAV